VSTKLDGTYICSYTVESLKQQLVNDGGVVIDIINVVMFEQPMNAEISDACDTTGDTDRR
jgi:hypothetical protein